MTIIKNPSNITVSSISQHVLKKLWNILTELIKFTDYIENNLSIFISIKYTPIKTIFVYLGSSKMRCIMHRPDFYNLQTRESLKSYNSTNRTFR